jgi:hypothetical protein
MIRSMTREKVKEMLDRLLTWPLERQEDAVRMLIAMQEQDASPRHGRERYATDEEMAALWKKCGL